MASHTSQPVLRLAAHPPFRVARADLPAQTPYGLRRIIHQIAVLASCALHWSSSCRRCRNINLLSIDYAFRPRLRYRLTLGGRTCPRKPWDSGGRDSHPTFRYSCPHNHFCTVHGRFPFRFNPVQNAPLPFVLRRIRSFGNRFDSRSFSARDHSTSQLLRTV